MIKVKITKACREAENTLRNEISLYNHIEWVIKATISFVIDASSTLIKQIKEAVVEVFEAGVDFGTYMGKEK